MKKNVFYLIGIIFLLVSCYPEGPEYYEDLDLVYTNYDDAFDFSSKSTYAMPDKIVKVTGDISEGEDPEFVQEPINSKTLQKIKDNMEANGWTMVDDPANADLVLFPAVWSNTTVVYWYDYWCWYYYYYCGWGWTYPSVASYTTGTLVMTLIEDDENSVEPGSTWVGAANGVLSGSYDISRVNNAIDKAFEQSPYLKVN